MNTQSYTQPQLVIVSGYEFCQGVKGGAPHLRLPLHLDR